MVSISCEVDEHFAMDRRNKSVKTFAIKRLDDGTPAAQVSHELTSGMDSIDVDQAGLKKPGFIPTLLMTFTLN